MRFTILTLFPEMLVGPLDHSIVGRARKRGQVTVATVQIRDFAPPPHQRVDDAPYGGGPGMVLKPDVLERALAEAAGRGPPAHVVYLTPQGAPFRQETAQRLATREHVVLLCGHYEGVDERLLDARVDEEISLGDFVLTGGEIPALAVVDAVTRLLPGVLGDQESSEADSFSADGLLDHPHVTRPPVWQTRPVPEVLLSGHHGQVAAWRRRQSLLRTLIRRPDLLSGAHLDKAERRLLEGLSQLLEEAEQALADSEDETRPTRDGGDGHHTRR